MRFSWKIGGEAGFGIATSGLAFSKIAARHGYHVFDYIAYPSLIRGSHNTFEAQISDEKVTSLKSSIDFLVCLNKQTFELHKNRLNSKSYVIYDKQEFDVSGNYVKIAIPIGEIIKKLKGDDIMKNTIMLGSCFALLGADISIYFNLINEQFERKGKEIIDFNKKFAREGYNYVIKNYSKDIKNLMKKKVKIREKIVISGNEAFSLASVIADCRLYAAYPMTPASSVLTTLALWQRKTGMIVRHPEDEIAAINTAIGASFAGARSSVGTSGGGFALMTESISFAGVAEIPLVVFMAQRAGPATGMPTWTEQGDLLFSIFSGHGEFPKIVLAPGDCEEMISLTAKAYNLSDIYQTPVIILSDMFLSEAHMSLDKERIMDFISKFKINRGKTNLTCSDKKYLRYKESLDGISERLIPGVKGHFYQANSYEHLQDGHTTEDKNERINQVNKRNNKTKTYLSKHFSMPTIYGDLEKSKLVFVSWGSCKGPILEAQILLKEKKIKSSFIHFTHIWPLSGEKIIKLFKKDKQYVLIENNSQAQFGKILTMETGIEIKKKLLKYDGRQLMPEEIVKFILTKVNLKQ